MLAEPKASLAISISQLLLATFVLAAGYADWRPGGPPSADSCPKLPRSLPGGLEPGAPRDPARAPKAQKEPQKETPKQHPGLKKNPKRDPRGQLRPKRILERDTEKPILQDENSIVYIKY